MKDWTSFLATAAAIQSLWILIKIGIFPDADSPPIFTMERYFGTIVTRYFTSEHASSFN